MGVHDLTHLNPSLIRDFKLPIDSGMSNNSLCCKSSEFNCTQFPISEKKMGRMIMLGFLQ